MVREEHDQDEKEEDGLAGSSDDDDDVKQPLRTEYRKEENRSKLGHLVGHLSEWSSAVWTIIFET